MTPKSFISDYNKERYGYVLYFFTVEIQLKNRLYIYCIFVKTRYLYD